MANGEPEFDWTAFPTPPIQHEAADLIAALKARLAEAERVIGPFAARCDEAVRPDDSDRGVTVKTAHLRAARAWKQGGADADN